MPVKGNTIAVELTNSRFLSDDYMSHMNYGRLLDAALGFRELRLLENRKTGQVVIVLPHEYQMANSLDRDSKYLE